MGVCDSTKTFSPGITKTKKFIFKGPCDCHGFKKELFIKPNKTIKDLLKFFFQEIGHPELFYDEDINFICDSIIIDKNSDKLISKFCEENSTIDNQVFRVDGLWKYNYFRY